MAEGGWIKVHRKLKNWRWYRDQPTKALFLHLLLEADWVDEKRGQVVTTEADLEKETGLSRQQVRTAMKHLISTNEITKEVTNGLTNKVTDKRTVITIENYSIYQDKLVGCNQDANQQDNQHPTNEQPTSNQSTIDIKNTEEIIKNYKNNSACAHARHADGVPMSDELKRMREQIRRGQLEYAEYERGLNT